MVTRSYIREDGVTELWIYNGDSNGMPIGICPMTRRVISPTLEIISNVWVPNE